MLLGRLRSVVHALDMHGKQCLKHATKHLLENDDVRYPVMVISVPTSSLSSGKAIHNGTS